MKSRWLIVLSICAATVMLLAQLWPLGTVGAAHNAAPLFLFNTLMVDPPTIDFGDVPAGQSVKRQVTLTGTIGQPPAIMIDSPEVSSGDPDFFIATPPDRFVIDNGDRATFEIGFSRSAMGAVTGQIRIGSNYNSVSVSVRANVVAPPSRPALQVSTNNINFGTVQIGDSTSSMVTVTNTGNSPINNIVVELMGGSSSAFAVNTPARTLAPGQMTGFTVGFRPNNLGMATATVAVRSDANTEIISVVGNSNDTTPPRVTLNAAPGSQPITSGSPQVISFSGTDNDQVSAYIVSYSTDGGTTFDNDIGRVSGDETQVIWNVPDLLQSTQTRIRVSAFDPSGNRGSVMSGNFTVMRATDPKIVPVLQVVLTFDPPPAGQILPPQNVRIAVTEFMPTPAAEPVSFPTETTPVLVGFNLFRVPAPPPGERQPTAEEITGDPRNLVASIGANMNSFTDLISSGKGQNFIYSINSSFGNGMQSSGTPPIGTNIPVIRNPLFTKGSLLIDATASFITSGATISVETETFPLELDMPNMKFVVSKKALSMPGRTKVKKILKVGRTVRLMVRNPDGKQSLGVMYMRDK